METCARSVFGGIGLSPVFGNGSAAGLVIAVFVASNVINSGCASQQAIQRQEACRSLGEVAYAVARGRQQGLTLEQVQVAVAEAFPQMSQAGLLGLTQSIYLGGLRPGDARMVMENECQKRALGW